MQVHKSGRDEPTPHSLPDQPRRQPTSGYTRYKHQIHNAPLGGAHTLLLPHGDTRRFTSPAGTNPRRTRFLPSHAGNRRQASRPLRNDTNGPATKTVPQAACPTSGTQQWTAPKHPPLRRSLGGAEAPQADVIALTHPLGSLTGNPNQGWATEAQA